MDVEYSSEMEQVQATLDGRQQHSKDTAIQEEEERLITVDDILNFYSNRH
ncbi:hypothetical protein [Paenibacillus brevis]|uniref:DUF4025 domain-containing protein n=1 Tax=Paenibacillus brevis TaxID=2841508 RepID=A0ABS6FSL3_9BACL|nr:hypothetical protein [Paenibacillus brevis]MBU5673109.1 hypothetical protein [Paenibacillus brevis]